MASPLRHPKLPDYNVPTGTEPQTARTRSKLKENVTNEREVVADKEFHTLCAEIAELPKSEDDKIKELLAATKFERMVRLTEIALTDKTQNAIRALERLSDMEDGGKLPQRKAANEDDEKISGVVLDV